MGNKIHPYGFRVGVRQRATGKMLPWLAVWFPGRLRDYARLVEADHKIRDTIKKRHRDAAVDRVEIIRTCNMRGVDNVEIRVHTARPGALIGKKGESINRTVAALRKILPDQRISIKAIEIRDVDLFANVVADNIRRQVEARRQVRRVCRQAVEGSI
ncbi:KH domain-containing protein, partial [bacterium]|nr:KH domain-containing protein [bacterium]